MLGWLAYLEGRLDEALGHYRRADEIEPFHAKMLRAAVHVLRNEGSPLARDPQGLLELTLHPSRYDWAFVPVSGSYSDHGSARCHR